MKEIYITSATLLENARDELLSNGVTGIHQEFLQLKFMGCLIHNDCCREMYNLTVNPTLETSKVLALSSIIMKLFEANRWYSTFGNRGILELAEIRGVRELVQAKLSEMKRLRPQRIEAYADIRNRLSGHYNNSEAFEMLQKLGGISYDTFFKDIEMMVQYSHEWLQALMSMGKLDIPELELERESPDLNINKP